MLAGFVTIVVVIATYVVLLESDANETQVVSTVTIGDGLLTTESVSTLQLSAGGLNVSAAPCPVVNPARIARATIAFKGSVTAVGEGIVKLRVVTNYTGVNTEMVTVSASQGVDYWLGPIAWEPGSNYLITANAGLIQFCGQSGKATPDLQAIFDEAFPG